MSDGIITDLDGKWESVMGYKPSELKGRGMMERALFILKILKVLKKLNKI